MRPTQENLNMVRNERRIRRHNDFGGDELRRRHIERRKKRQRQIAAIRSALMFLIFAALICVIIFMTPLFNIRRITVSGNNVITLEEINQYIGDLNGRNLLKTDEYDVKARLSGIAYIKDISVSKNYLKTSLNVNITEREACGYLGLSGKYVLFDNECIILAEASQKPEGIPLIIGINDSDDDNISLNMSGEKIDIMIECIGIMRELELLDKVNNIDLSDETQIRFEYEDRLDVLCGSRIDMDRKLRLFGAMINNNNLAQNAQGTVDLSITGNARYSPEKAQSIKTASSETKLKEQNTQNKSKE